MPDMRRWRRDPSQVNIIEKILASHDVEVEKLTKRVDELLQENAQEIAGRNDCRCISEPEVGVFDPRGCPQHAYEEGVKDGRADVEKLGAQLPLPVEIVNAVRLYAKNRAAYKAGNSEFTAGHIVCGGQNVLALIDEMLNSPRQRHREKE